MRSDYVSEFTQFIDHYLADHPEVIDSQRLGWNQYWNRPIQFDELKKAMQDSSPVLPYYFPNSTQGLFRSAQPAQGRRSR
jgi:hypothetical protein